jgi:hypothetical protein
MKNQRIVACCLAILASTWPLCAQDGPKQSFEVISNEHMNFAPGGTIRVDHSYGHLTVEGWDEPEVYVTVIKTTNNFYKPSQKEQAVARFQKIRVATERRSGNELAISTILPSHPIKFLPPSNQAGVTLEYRVLVPRDSRLVVRHGTGYVWISDVTGDLEVRSHTGDMIVMLPDPGPYTIDAKTGMGNITSDFVGKSGNRLLVGSHFSSKNEAPSRRIFLRIGSGCITIKQGLASGTFTKNDLPDSVPAPK